MHPSQFKYAESLRLSTDRSVSDKAGNRVPDLAFRMCLSIASGLPPAMPLAGCGLISVTGPVEWFDCFCLTGKGQVCSGN